MAVTVNIETITPEMAKAMLEGNTGNFRNVDRSRVIRYAADMKAGRWPVTGDSVKFNGQQLKDGQHRLIACVRSGVPFDTVVAKNVQDDAVLNIDRGKPRSVGQWLRHLGVPSYNAAAAISRSAICYDKGLWAHHSWGAETTTDIEVIEYAKKHQQSIHSAYKTAARQNLVTKTILGTILHIGCGRGDATNDAVCKWFAERLADGIDLQSTDPVWLLRNRFEKENRGLKKTTPFLQRQLATKAWNSTVKGEELTSLFMRFTGPTKTKPIKVILTTEDSNAS